MDGLRSCKAKYACFFSEDYSELRELRGAKVISYGSAATHGFTVFWGMCTSERRVRSNKSKMLPFAFSHRGEVDLVCRGVEELLTDFICSQQRHFRMLSRTARPLDGYCPKIRNSFKKRMIWFRFALLNVISVINFRLDLKIFEKGKFQHISDAAERATTPSGSDNEDCVQLYDCSASNALHLRLTTGLSNVSARQLATHLPASH